MYAHRVRICVYVRKQWFLKELKKRQAADCTLNKKQSTLDKAAD